MKPTRELNLEESDLFYRAEIAFLRLFEFEREGEDDDQLFYEMTSNMEAVMHIIDFGKTTSETKAWLSRTVRSVEDFCSDHNLPVMKGNE